MTEPMKTDEQYPSTPLEKEAVQYVANDDLAMFADDDTRMIYEHYYIKGYEKAVAAEREKIKKDLGKSIIEHEYELDFPGDPVINVSVLFKLIDNL